MNTGGAVQYGKPGLGAAAFQRTKVSSLPFLDVVEALRREIEGAGLWVLHEIDPQKVLQRGGYAIGAARQILFFHPDLMVRLLRADPSALLDVPLKFAVMELPDGTVTVRWIDPSAAFARYGNLALTSLGQELALECERIASASLEPTSRTSG